MRAAAERQREAERQHPAAFSAVTRVIVAGGAATGFAFATPSLAETGMGHHLYSLVSAAQLYYRSAPRPDANYPDPLHPAEPSATFYTQWYGGGTARTDIAVGPVEPVSWNGSEWSGPLGPNIFGD
jgi:hypothetical protein